MRNTGPAGARLTRISNLRESLSNPSPCTGRPIAENPARPHVTGPAKALVFDSHVLESGARETSEFRRCSNIGGRKDLVTAAPEL